MTRKLLLAAFAPFALAVILTSCKKERTELAGESALADGSGFITGMVVTQNGKTPVGAAKVFVDVEGEVFFTQADDKGKFKLEAPVGEQQLTVHTGDGQLFRTLLSVNVSRDETTDQGSIMLKQVGQLAFIAGAYDEIETIVVDSLGYTCAQLQVSDLSSLSTLNQYSAIFLNCGHNGTLDSLKYKNLNDYVAGGGSLYASDWAVEYLTGDGNWKNRTSHSHHEGSGTFTPGMKASCNVRVGGFIPDSILCTEKQGSTGLVTSCAIVDAGLQTALGKTSMDVDYDLGGWEIIQQLGPQFNVLIQDNNTYGPLAVRSNVNANWGTAVNSGNGNGNGNGNGGGWVTICHLPPGNPSNVQTITISVNALAAHLAHGCYVGSCTPDGGIFYTTFHNHPQGHISSDVKNVLQYYILNL